MKKEHKHLIHPHILPFFISFLNSCIKTDQTSKYASQLSCYKLSPSPIIFCEQKITSSSSIGVKKLSSSLSVGSSSILKKQCYIFIDTSSFYQIVIGCYSYIEPEPILYLIYFCSPMKNLYISSCFFAATCIAWRCRANAEERRELEPPLKLIACIWLGEIQSICYTCSLRSNGNKFSCSFCLKGLGISSSCSLETLLFEIRREFLENLGTRLSASRGELLKLCIIRRSLI